MHCNWWVSFTNVERNLFFVHKITANLWHVHTRWFSSYHHLYVSESSPNKRIKVNLNRWGKKNAMQEKNNRISSVTEQTSVSRYLSKPYSHNHNTTRINGSFSLLFNALVTRWFNSGLFRESAWLYHLWILMISSRVWPNSGKETLINHKFVCKTFTCTVCEWGLLSLLILFFPLEVLLKLSIKLFISYIVRPNKELLPWQCIKVTTD